MTCLTCHHSALRHPAEQKRDAAVRAMAKAGFANCTASEGAATFYPFSHRCGKWAEAPAAVIESRQRWVAKSGVEHG